MSELTTFDPDAIQTTCDRNLAAGLRAIAAALDAGTITAKCLGAAGHGFAHDNLAHVLLKIDIAAPVFSRPKLPI